MPTPPPAPYKIPEVKLPPGIRRARRTGTLMHKVMTRAQHQQPGTRPPGRCDSRRPGGSPPRSPGGSPALYNRFYNATIEKAMVPIGKEMNAWFISGFWGNYFTNMMKPKTVYEVGKKMKTLKNQRPGKSLNVDKVFTEFFQHQNKLLQLLEIARKRNLNTIKIPISISRLMKFKLGDTFRFLIAHEQRHMIQARNAIHAVGVPTDKFPVILEAAQL